VATPARHEPPSGTEHGPPRAAELPEAELASAAWEWRGSAPELSRLLARHGAGRPAGMRESPDGERALRLRVADFLADCRLGHGSAGAHRACGLLEAARAGEAGELEHALLLELAGCAAGARVPAAGIVALARVLDQAEPTRDRAAALLVLARCVPDAASGTAARNAISAAE
jgi:hypothetical protein